MGTTTMNPRLRAPRVSALALLIGATAGASTLAASPAWAAGELHVATGGSDSAAGTAAAPLRTVQAAIDRATPGTTIKVHQGTYSQVLNIKNSGTSAATPVQLGHAPPPIEVASEQFELFLQRNQVARHYGRHGPDRKSTRLNSSH